MPGGRSIHRRILPGMLVLLLMVLLLAGCGRMTDTSGLTGLWVLDNADSDTVLIPPSLVEENRLILRLDPDGSGVMENASSQGRIVWKYEDATVVLRAGDSLCAGQPGRDTGDTEPGEGRAVSRQLVRLVENRGFLRGNACKLVRLLRGV